MRCRQTDANERRKNVLDYHFHPHEPYIERASIGNDDEVVSEINLGGFP